MSETESKIDVLVVGAGPVGLVLACELARRGTRFRLIDKLDRPTDESRAIIVHARSLEMMERIGIADVLARTGVKTTAMTMYDGNRELGCVRLDTVDSPFPFSISTAQTETERVLTERLSELGGTVERGLELIGLEQDDRQVRSTVRHPDGSEETVVSAYLAGTDGSHSTVRHQLGMKLEGSFKGERFLLGDVEADCDLERSSMHSYFAADAGPLLVFPMLGSRLRLIAQITGGQDPPESLASLQAACDHSAPGIKLRSSHWITIFEIHHAQVPRYQQGRAFLLGDAAHVHSPAGGQGMNTGMQDAFNLGWKLALVAADEAAPALLESYHAERHPVAARVIRDTTRLTRMGTLEHTLARELRNAGLHAGTALAPVQHVLARQTEETDIAYRDSPIVAAAGRRARGPRPGDAAPDVPGLGVPLHVALARASGHLVLSVAPSGGAAPRPGAAPGTRYVLVGGAPGAAGFDEVIPDPERLVAARYGLGDAGGLVVVRPDGYIGLRARLGDSDAVASYFAGIAGGPAQ